MVKARLAQMEPRRLIKSKVVMLHQLKRIRRDRKLKLSRWKLPTSKYKNIKLTPLPSNCDREIMSRAADL